VSAKGSWGAAARVDQRLWVAELASRKRAALLSAYRGKLRPDELEECLSQAVLELLVRAGRGDGFASPLHVERSLEQKLRSRITDRLRARAGRSPLLAAIERSGGDAELAGVADPRVGVEETVALRELLVRITEAARKLTAAQRLALATQLGAGGGSGAGEKERKARQRAREKLRALVLEGWDG